MLGECTCTIKVYTSLNLSCNGTSYRGRRVKREVGSGGNIPNTNISLLEIPLKTAHQERGIKRFLIFRGLRYASPLPNISNLAILISPRKKKTPQIAKMGSPKEFPAVTRIKGICGNSTETLKNRNFPAHPDFGFWGPHFQRFGGK